MVGGYVRNAQVSIGAQFDAAYRAIGIQYRCGCHAHQGSPGILGDSVPEGPAGLEGRRVVALCWTGVEWSDVEEVG